MKARIMGVQTFMTTFEFYFGCSLGELLLSQIDNLSKTLQNPTLSASESYLIKTLQKDQCGGKFNLWWDAILKQKETLDIQEPIIKRKKRLPKRYDDFPAMTDSSKQDPKKHHEMIFNNTYDVAITAISNRFEQPDFEIYRELQVTKGSKKPKDGIWIV